MVKGGFQIIDLKNTNFTKGVGMQFDDVYEKIEGTNKAILLSGLTVGGLDYRDTFVTPRVSGLQYEFTCGDYVVVIEDTNVITVYDRIIFIEVDNFDGTEFTVDNYTYKALTEVVSSINSDFYVCLSDMEGKSSIVSVNTGNSEIVVISNNAFYVITVAGDNTIIVNSI